MAQTALNRSESPLLTALCETDLTAWCYLPVTNRELLCCSKAFLRLWRIDAGIWEKPTPGLLPEQSISEAFAIHGIDAIEFFAMVAERGETGGPPILLVRKDSMKLNAEVTLVSSGLRVVGHLIRFREIVEPNVIDAVLREISDAQQRLEVLSPREREMLNGICQGHTNKSISIAAGISEKTVEKHRSRIMQKLKLHNSAELFRLASKAMILSEFYQGSELNGIAVSSPFSAGEIRTATDHLE